MRKVGSRTVCYSLAGIRRDWTEDAVRCLRVASVLFDSTLDSMLC